MQIVMFLAQKGGTHIAKIALAGVATLAAAFLAGRASKHNYAPPDKSKVDDLAKEIDRERKRHEITLP